MTASGFVIYTLIFLTFSVVLVPLSKRFGFGSVLGYLVAGMLIGPSAFNLVHGSEDLAHFAELGVVFLLFLIGLELQPTKLWEMRRNLSVLGLGQILSSTLLLSVAIHFILGLSPVVAGVIGFSLALSSTAFSLQSLIEKGELKTQYGQATFSVLLMQDIVAIPVLALLPLISTETSIQGGPSSQLTAILYPIFFVVFLVISSRTWITHLFRWMAVYGSREILTAFTLLVVLGVSFAMYKMGLSMGLGSFLAGVLLADSEYRHEIEVDLEPFKALLMGFFFMSVGITVPIQKFIEAPFELSAWVLSFMAIKFAAMYFVARFAKLSDENSQSSALYLALGGEFAFVISGLAQNISVLNAEQASLINLVVTFSMILTPFLFLALEKVRIRNQARKRSIEEYDEIGLERPQVLIAGFGRFGQIFGRILRAQGIPFVAVDHDPDQIQLLRKFGNKVYYGDCSREQILHAAGAQEAKFIVIAVDDIGIVNQTVEVVKNKFSHLKIFARARNRQHAFELMDQGVKHVKRETIDSSINFVEELLVEMGLSHKSAGTIVSKFREHDLALLQDQYKNRMDEKALISASKLAVEQLERVMREDVTQSYVSFPPTEGATREDRM